MDLPDVSLRRVAVLVGYGVFGAVGTAALAVTFAVLTRPLQTVVYRTFYLSLGPWSATTAATIIQFALLGALAAGVPTVFAVLRVRGRRLAVRAVGVLAAVLLVFALVLVGAAAAGVLAFLTVIGIFVIATVAVPVALWRFDTDRRPVATFLGTVPVLALLVLALGFGLGWGGGYYLTAEVVDPGSVDASSVADFDAVPTVRDDLFAASSCDPYDDGVCRLSLRGYDHEARAARFLARHGVRCPFLNAPPGGTDPGDGSFIAEHNGTFYRVSCVAFGD